jgi:serine/threonine protein kinase
MPNSPPDHTRASPSTHDTDPSATYAQTAVPDLPGKVAVPGYEVLGEVARGGMGVVYRARDPRFERAVAIKVMHAGQDAQRFVVEAQVTAQLPHPGVPPVHELGRLADGRPFLAMKLIEGRTLGDEMKGATAADLPRLLAAFERICETVGFAHARGIVHRDLKPANVMVGAFGEVLVMDWGLAKDSRRAEGGTRTEATVALPLVAAARAADTLQTLAGTVKGTPAYMAPEQARGEAVDSRADVFALGGILAAILTRRARPQSRSFNRSPSGTSRRRRNCSLSRSPAPRRTSNCCTRSASASSTRTWGKRWRTYRRRGRCDRTTLASRTGSR